MSTIIFIEDSSKSLMGGGQKISSIVLGQLQRYGKRVVYVDFAENPNLKVRLDLRSSRVLKLYKLVPYKSLGNLLEFFVIIPNFFILSFTILKEKNPIVYVTSKRGLIYGGICALLFRVNYIYHAHMVLQGKFYDRLILFFIRNGYYCIYVSEYVQREYQKRGINNGILLENPVESFGFMESKLKRVGVFRVFFIGSVIEVKGLNYLLDVFSIYSDCDLEIHVLGTGNLLDNYKKLYGSNRQIIFHGFVKDVDPFLNEIADVLVLPTIISEAAPTVIQQAMLHGVPVITTDIGGQRSCIDDGINGILVRPADTKDILEAILRMKDDSDFHESLSFNCKEKAKGFKTVDEFGNGLIDIVNQVCV